MLKLAFCIFTFILLQACSDPASKKSFYISDARFITPDSILVILQEGVYTCPTSGPMGMMDNGYNRQDGKGTATGFSYSRANQKATSLFTIEYKNDRFNSYSFHYPHLAYKDIIDSSMYIYVADLQQGKAIFTRESKYHDIYGYDIDFSLTTDDSSIVISDSIFNFHTLMADTIPSNTVLYDTISISPQVMPEKFNPYMGSATTVVTDYDPVNGRYIILIEPGSQLCEWCHQVYLADSAGTIHDSISFSNLL